MAPGTKKILKGLEEPINLYFFFSEKAADSSIPELKTYGTRVRELLQELAARSGGKLHLPIIDPQPFSEDEDRAAELGVRGVPSGPTGDALLRPRRHQFHRRQQAIEFFDPRKEEFLEYDVVKLIYQLANPKKPVIGWMSGLPMPRPRSIRKPGQPREPPVVYTQAQQLFDVKQVTPVGDAIDPDVDVLVIVHPKGLAPATQFAIDQYALRGGRIIMFVDPLAEADQAGADPQNPMAAMTADKSSDLGPLLAAWGVDFNPKTWSATTSMRCRWPCARASRRCAISASSASTRTLRQEGRGGCRPLDRERRTIGHVDPRKGATTKFEPLMQSSTEAAIIPTQKFAMLFDPNTLRDGFKPTGKTLHARGARHRQSEDGVPERRARRRHGARRAARSRSRRSRSTSSCSPTRTCCMDFLWVRHAELLRSARGAGLGEQRRPRRQRAGQPRRQHGPDQRARPRHVHASLRSRGRAAPQRPTTASAPRSRSSRASSRRLRRSSRSSQSKRERQVLDDPERRSRRRSSIASSRRRCASARSCARCARGSIRTSRARHHAEGHQHRGGAGGVR